MKREGKEKGRKGKGKEKKKKKERKREREKKGKKENSLFITLNRLGKGKYENWEEKDHS